jgi:hypothetical protein
MSNLWRNLKAPIYISVILTVGFTLLTPLGSIAFADGETPTDPAPAEAQVGDGEAGNSEVETPDEAAAAVEADATAPEGETVPGPGTDGPVPEGNDQNVNTSPGEILQGDSSPSRDGEASAADEVGTDPTSDASPSPDPYYTVNGTLYRFFSGIGACGGAANCFDSLVAPIQYAIDYLSGTLDEVPVDETIHVEDGNYSETVTVDGTEWGSRPSRLVLQSQNGSGSTTITGGMFIQNMVDFVLRGFTVTAGVTAASNGGTLTLDDVVADSTSSSGITVGTHIGDVVLDGVQANSNSGGGAVVNNTAGGGNVSVMNSTFNDNGGAGLDIQSNGAVTVEDVTASGNLGGDGASLRGNGVTVRRSSFNNNANPTPSDQYGNGLAVESDGGPVLLEGVTANGNEESGGLIWFGAPALSNAIEVRSSTFKNNGDFGVFADPETGTVTFDCIHTYGNASGGTMVPAGEIMIWIKCACKGEDDKEPGFKTVLLSTTDPVRVNAGNGILVTFPPIEIIDVEDYPWGRITPLKWDELPAALPEGDVFRAGVDVELINALIPDGSYITLEFYVSGFLWDLPFSVLWWDTAAAEWVEVTYTLEPHPRLPGGRAIVEWPEPGVFVLVAE